MQPGIPLGKISPYLTLQAAVAASSTLAEHRLVQELVKLDKKLGKTRLDKSELDEEENEYVFFHEVRSLVVKDICPRYVYPGILMLV